MNLCRLSSLRNCWSSAAKTIFHLVDTVPEFGFVYRQVLESAYLKSQERIYCFQSLEALEKVRWVLTNQSKWLTRLLNKMVASYLGLTPQTLSRLKSKL